MEKEYKPKGYARSKKNIKKQVCVISGNLTAAADCVNKRLVTLTLKYDGFELCVETKLVSESPEKSKIIHYLCVLGSIFQLIR